MTDEEKELAAYMWTHDPCTLKEIVDRINQFRDCPVSEDEVMESIDSLI